MNFASDNTSGASPRLLAAMNQAAVGRVPSYGEDAYTIRAGEKLAQVFDHEVQAFFVATGTASNCLAISAFTPSNGVIFCHDQAHIRTSEENAPAFFTGGAEMIGMPGEGGKISPAILESTLHDFSRNRSTDRHASILSLTQATEIGSVYRPQEIKALCDVARQFNLAVHMDGARFANAVVHTGASPADLTWKAGVDVLSLGATKNGAPGAEAVVFFKPVNSETFSSRLTRTGQMVSKSRWMGAQMEAWLAEDHWLNLAKTANDRTQELAAALAGVDGVRIVQKPEINLIFAVLSADVHQRLQAGGVVYYQISPEKLPAEERLAQGEVFVRLACSFNTSSNEVHALAACAKGVKVKADDPASI